MNIKPLNHITTYKRFAHGEVIVDKSDETTRELYLLWAGSVALMKWDSLSQAEHMTTCLSGQFFAEQRLFGQPPFEETAIATEDCVVIALDHDNFLQFCKHNPASVFDLLSQLYNDLAHANAPQTKLQTLAGISQPKKTATPITKPAATPASLATLQQAAQQTKKTLQALQAPAKPANTTTTTPASGKLTVSDLQALYPDFPHTLSDLGHKAEYDRHLIAEKYVCQQCKHTFTSMYVLQLTVHASGDMQCDLRKRYSGFAPHWYDVITCPHCLFSMLGSHWSAYCKLSPAQKEHLQTLKERLVLDFCGPRDFNAIVASYFLAILCANGHRSQDQILTKLWRQLSWVYEHLGNHEAQLAAAKEAYLAAQSFYDNAELTPEQSQSTLMILGTLAHQCNDLENAVRYLGLAKLTRNGKPLYKQLIGIELDEVKDKYRAQKALQANENDE